MTFQRKVLTELLNRYVFIIGTAGYPEHSAGYAGKGNDMKELYQNLYKETITYSDRHISPRNLYIIKGKPRSLMVDTSFRLEHDWNVIRKMIGELGIDYGKLDLFITHSHPDHVGLVPELEDLGVRIFMNPDEIREPADLVHCYLLDEETRIRNLRIVGVTPEVTPEVYDAVIGYTRMEFAKLEGRQDFSYIPVSPGDRLSYGGYELEVFPLKGHTFGQCGLVEREKKILFCGDQIMTDIVPIVCSQRTDQGLLASYMESLGDLKHNYRDYELLSCHYGKIKNVRKEANRIIFGYLDKCAVMKKILDDNGGGMTTRDIGVRTYGRSQGPPDHKHFASCTHIWSKTFSCMEYMYGQGLVDRTERNGIIYWKPLAIP